MSRTFLTVSYREKDAAKALGARWDNLERKWYVPAGLQLAPFAAWLPAQAAELVSTDPLLPADLSAAQRGVPLSQLLTGVARAVASAFAAGVWTFAEVLRVSAKDGHVYLELSERSADGRVVAKAQAAIWSRTAEQIVPEFERSTGAILAAGIKLLVRARPVFKPQYGFSLEIDGIDPTYTLGDLEARKREIRERLKREGLYGQNKALPSPWDYARVLVVSPEAAAGLGDFAKEAARLERFGLCRFDYAHARFQGESAAAEICEALLRGVAQQGRALDAAIVIRGGGAVNDLAWLNDYDLARAICECPIPVLTGIGHERDNTVLDEVAQLRFDTPSKVIAGIEQHIVRRAQAARSNFDLVVGNAASSAERTRARTDRLEQEVRARAMTTLLHARAHAREFVSTIQDAARGALHQADRQAHTHMADVRHGASNALTLAQREVPAALDRVLTHAQANIKAARHGVQQALPIILARAAGDVKRSSNVIQEKMDLVATDAYATLDKASQAAQGLFREIAGQGPQKTLSRGFAVVRSADGKTLITARSAGSAGGPVTITFADGVARATVQSVRLTTDVETKDETE